MTYSLSLGSPYSRVRDQFPGERDGVALEVVAEGEIAQHLEKRVVPPGIADVFEIVVLSARPHAFLRRRSAQ